MSKGFKCINCGRVVEGAALGTEHRNHCPFCLASVHLDLKVPGDRLSKCHGLMQPIGLAFKEEGGRRQGELTLVHRCERCGAVSRNRIAGDDDPESVVTVFKQSLKEKPDALVLDAEAADEIIRQLFGQPNLKRYKEQFDL